MQSRNTLSLVTSLLLTAVACAYQNAGAGVDDGQTSADDGGTSPGGTSAGATSSKAGTSSLSVSGTTSVVGTAGKTSSSGGTGTDLPPAGSSGKTSTGGSGGKGGSSSGGKGGSGGKAGADTAGGAGGADTGPVNMPIAGLSVTFTAASTSDPNDFMGGELAVISDAAQPLSLADLKIRYYFSDEITAATPTVTMNWARFGAQSNLGDATCTGTVVKSPDPKPGADSYVELTCSSGGGSELTPGKLLKISWKAGAQGMGKLIQANDWSFTDPKNILILNGNTIIWGIEPS